MHNLFETRKYQTIKSSKKIDDIYALMRKTELKSNSKQSQKLKFFLTIYKKYYKFASLSIIPILAVENSIYLQLS